jgi:probable DNA metabolism protein
MIKVALNDGADFDGFRQAVRSLLAKNVRPEEVAWEPSGIADMFGNTPDHQAPQVTLPAEVVSLAKSIICHRDPERYALLYHLIWRIRHGEKHLLDVASDPVVHRLLMMRKAIGRDLHKMHAFLRFRRIADEPGEKYVAWFEPQNYILQEAAEFFVSRFANLEWSILTPIGSLFWDRRTLQSGPPAQKSDLPPVDDAFEKGWVGYYRSTFNPARTNTRIMQSEMPKKYWKNMPEAAAIADMVREAPGRVHQMMLAMPTIQAKRTPEKAMARGAHSAPESLDALNEIIARAEPFVRGGTKAVLGEGSLRSKIAFVGEQPGDQEDIAGRPFVGPAGKLFDRALAEAGISREESYVTNAVKHFKFAERGKRRIHQSPTHGEIKHYRWWLEKEIAFVQPRLIVALGASAAFALANRSISVTRERGESEFAVGKGFVTIHPSYLLRLQEPEDATTAYSAFVDDLKNVRQLAEAA